MDRELKLQIGGIGISINWDGSKMTDWPHPHYQDFMYEGKTEVNLKIHCGNLPSYPQDKLIFDGEETGCWKLYRKNSRYVIETYDTLTHKKNKVCFVKPDFSSGDIYVDSQSYKPHQPSKIPSSYPVWSLPSLMQPLGQLLLINILARGGGTMVHGLGINDGGKGIAFVGGSGAGKSTLAGLWQDQERVDILSDEHIIIRKKNEQFWLYGTPWPGMAMAASSKKVGLEKLFFIGHFSENKILGQASLSDLFPLLFLPFWDEIGLSKTMQFCEDLLRRMDCRRLGFSKDKGIVRFVREINQKGVRRNEKVH